MSIFELMMNVIYGQFPDFQGNLDQFPIAVHDIVASLDPDAIIIEGKILCRVEEVSIEIDINRGDRLYRPSCCAMRKVAD